MLITDNFDRVLHGSCGCQLRRFFSEDLRFRIAAVIDIDAADHVRGNRQRFVERYLAGHNMEDAACITLDDDDGNLGLTWPFSKIKRRPPTSAMHHWRACLAPHWAGGSPKK